MVITHGRITLECPGGYHWNEWADKNGMDWRIKMESVGG